MRSTLIVCCCALAAVAFAGDDVMFTCRMNKTSAKMLLLEYEVASGTRVEVVQGVDAVFTIHSEKSLGRAEYLHLLETSLKEQNIGLFSIASNRLVATWIDLSKVKPKPSRRLKGGTIYQSGQTKRESR